jgi:NAD(P)-dependent dehydrogenase (short-subunit alcohol dehydrogenase family)
MKRILITGASRGIGLEMCKQLSEQGNEVIATYRSPTSAGSLLELTSENKNLHSYQLDVNFSESVKTAICLIAEKFTSLDLVFNNAGILDWSPLGEVTAKSFQSIYNTNVVGVFRVSEEVIPLLTKGSNPLIINLSSRLGSIELRGQSQLGGAIAYQCSKAALNMLTKQMSIDYNKHGIRAIAISPGWVKTDMGGTEAKYEVSESVNLFLSQIDKLPASLNGIFLGEDGKMIPW